MNAPSNEFSKRQTEFVNVLNMLPNPEEQLTWMSQRATSRLWQLPEAERTEARLVPGCVSQVWVAGKLRSGKGSFLLAADSSLVAGLVWAQLALVQNLEPAEIAAAEFNWLSRSGLDRQLSPTRLNGMDAVAQWLKSLACFA